MIEIIGWVALCIIVPVGIFFWGIYTGYYGILKIFLTDIECFESHLRTVKKDLIRRGCVISNKKITVTNDKETL